MDRLHESGSGISQEERLRSLLSVSRRLGAIHEPEKLIRALANEIRTLLTFDYLGLFLNDVVEEGPSWYILDVGSQSILARANDGPPERQIGSWVMLHQKVVSLPPSGEDPPFPELEEILAPHGVSSFCALPLTTMRRQLGAVFVASRKARAYPEEEKRFLSLVADQVALAIDDAANFARLRLAQADLRRSNERLKLVLDVGQTFLSNLDLQELFRSISASTRNALRCEAVSISLTNADQTEAHLFMLDFPNSWGFAREGSVIPIAGSSMEEVLRTGRPVELGRADREDPGKAIAMAEGLSGGFAFPLISRGRTLGVLAVARRGGESFGPDEKDLIGQIAVQMATALDNALAYSEIAELRDRLAQEKLYLEDELRSELSFDEIVGRSPALTCVLKQVEIVAQTDSTVLILGETGSGKELIARAIHDRGARSGRTFVKLDCAAIPAGLLEAELFGHQKGAFTGAIADRVGRFELASGGTVFLDEIGEVPLELQPKLLRVLQEGRFERLGSSKTVHSDARLIAATNRDLAAMVEAGDFRSDLFYRLAVFPIRVPALRERREDIPLLVRHFVQLLGRRMNKTVDTIPAGAMNALTRYPWPGNIRELQNLIERAMILTPGRVLRVPLGDLNSLAVPRGAANGPRSLREAERAHILATLEETGWVVGGVNGAAARLGMKRPTLQFWMKKLGLVRAGR